MKTVVCYLIDRIKSVGGHTTGLIVLVWNVGKLHTKTLGLGNNNFRWWGGMVVLKTVLIRIIWFLMTLHCSPPYDSQLIYYAIMQIKYISNVIFECFWPHHICNFLQVSKIKKMEKYTHGVQQNIKSNLKRFRSYTYLVTF